MFLKSKDIGGGYLHYNILCIKPITLLHINNILHITNINVKITNFLRQFLCLSIKNIFHTSNLKYYYILREKI